MGLGSNSGNAVFLSVTKLGFTKKVQTPTANSVSRVNNNGVEVHEEHYDYLEGVITGIKFEENQQYGNSVKITVNSEGTNYIVQCKHNSNSFRSFAKILPNADKTREVRLVHGTSVIEGTDITMISLSILQDGQFVKYAHTNGNPNGMPAATEYIDGEGQKRKSYLDQNKFLLDQALSYTYGTAQAAPTATLTAAAPEYIDIDEDEGDDLPF